MIPIKFASNSIKHLIGKPLAMVSFLIIALLMTGSIVVVLAIVLALWNVNLETLSGPFIVAWEVLRQAVSPDQIAVNL